MSDFFSGANVSDLRLAPDGWHEENDVILHLSERVMSIDRSARRVLTDRGRSLAYDVAVLATGSSPLVPPIPGRERPGVFVYRTIEDLKAIRHWAQTARSGAVIGGGLLGLEAAKALLDMGLETHVVEMAPRLMVRQTDAAGGAMLAEVIRKLGVRVHVDRTTTAIEGADAVHGLVFSDGERLPVDMVVISAGIRPNDELARACGIRVGERGGVVVDDGLRTSDPAICAIGEVALWNESIFGLVGPGYAMARTLSQQLTGGDARFRGADLSTKLKLLGVGVASFGDVTCDEATHSVVFEDEKRGIYKRLLIDEASGKLLGGVFVGDTDCYAELVALFRGGEPAPDELGALLFGGSPFAGALFESDAARGELSGPDSAQVCSCNDVCQGAIRAAVAEGRAATLVELKAETRAGTGCGGCLPQVEKILKIELAAVGGPVVDHLCEHFPYSRRELFEIVKIRRLETFADVLAASGSGAGCEVCKPAVASILASLWNEPIRNHEVIQDTNDRFLANIQRGGTYSVIPRGPCL